MADMAAAGFDPTDGGLNTHIKNVTPLGQGTKLTSSPVVPPSDYVAPVQGFRQEIIGQSAGNVTGITTDLFPSIDTTGYTCAVLQLTGTWSMTLQPAQCNDNATFLSVQSIAAQTFLTNTGLLNSLSANGLYIIPLTGRYLRIRPSAWNSNASCVGTLELYTTLPPFVIAALGTYMSLAPQTSGGPTTFHLIGTASTNATNIKPSAGQVYGYELSNNGTNWAYVKFYNKATTPVPGTDTPVRTVGLAPGSSKSYHSDVGIPFANGIGISTSGGATSTTSIQDSDATAVAVNTVSIDIEYK